MTDGGRLEAVGVTVQFEGVRALDGVDLHVERGEILGLIGPNGAGKTTMVNVLSGFQRPRPGSVLLDGADATRWPPHRRARKGLARTFQSTRLFGDLSVRENVEVAALSAHASPRQARAVAGEVLEYMALADRADEDAAALPYGDERRVSIARALAGRPRFLLLDEPAAGLNEGESDELVRSLSAIHERLGCGFVVIEHDMNLIMRLCQRIQVLDYGKTIAVGTPDVVKTSPEVLKAYLGDPVESSAHG